MSEEYVPSGSGLSFTVPVYSEPADGPQLAKDLADDVSSQFLTRHTAQTMTNKTLASDLAAGNFKVTGLAEPTSAQDAATKAYTDSLVALNVPVGTILPFAGSTAPTGWLFCRGQAIPRATNAALFSAIGVTYGGGNGSTTFQIPNLSGRSIFGFDSTNTNYDQLAKASSAGAKAETLISATNLPEHTHTHGHTHGTTTSAHSHSITDGAGSHSHGGSTSTHGGYSYVSNVDTTSTAQGGGAQPGVRSFSNLVVPHSHTISADGGHNHGVNGDGNHSHSTNSQDSSTTSKAYSASPASISTQNPYLTINFIIKAVA